MKSVQKFLSYVLVAALASFATMAAFGGIHGDGYDKLADMEQMIETYFIGETDRTAMADAAARAMGEALGDKWS